MPIHFRPRRIFSSVAFEFYHTVTSQQHSIRPPPIAQALYLTPQIIYNAIILTSNVGATMPRDPSLYTTIPHTLAPYFRIYINMPQRDINQLGTRLKFHPFKSDEDRLRVANQYADLLKGRVVSTHTKLSFLRACGVADPNKYKRGKRIKNIR